MEKNKYFADIGNDVIDDKGNVVARKMDTITSNPVSNKDFLNSVGLSEKAIFEYLLEYTGDASAYLYLVRGAVLRCDCGSHPRRTSGRKYTK